MFRDVFAPIATETFARMLPFSPGSDFLDAQHLIPKSEKGAAVMVHLATSPEAAGVTGHSFGPKKQEEPMPPFATDPANGARLWALSEELTRPERQAPP